MDIPSLTPSHKDQVIRRPWLFFERFPNGVVCGHLRDEHTIETVLKKTRVTELISK